MTCGTQPLRHLARSAALAAQPQARAAAALLLGDRLPGLASPAEEAPAIGPAPPTPDPGRSDWRR